MLDLYTDDAEMRVVNRHTPPSSPQVLRGKEEIAEYLKEVLSRDIKYRVENEVVGEDRVARSTWPSEYPDGTRVLAAGNLDVRDGKIVRQVEIVAWGE